MSGLPVPADKSYLTTRTDMYDIVQRLLPLESKLEISEGKEIPIKSIKVDEDEIPSHYKTLSEADLPKLC